MFPLFGGDDPSCDPPAHLHLSTGLPAAFAGGYPASMGFRCAHCYHLFGVDLIADAHRQLHVIEVNIAPDLTLSTEGACAATAHGCVGGSSIYDHTKRAAAYSSVRPSAAADRGRRVGARLGVGVGAREGVRVRVGPRGDEG